MVFAQEPHVQFASDQDVPLSFSCIGQTRDSLGMFYVSSIVRLQVKPAHRDEGANVGARHQHAGRQVWRCRDEDLLVGSRLAVTSVFPWRSSVRDSFALGVAFSAQSL